LLNVDLQKAISDKYAEPSATGQVFRRAKTKRSLLALAGVLEGEVAEAGAKAANIAIRGLQVRWCDWAKRGSCVCDGNLDG
jgi:hypothetical protein